MNDDLTYGFGFGVLFCLISLLGVALIGNVYSDDKLQKEAISKGYAYYDNNLKFRWRDNAKSKTEENQKKEITLSAESTFASMPEQEQAVR